MEISRLYEIAAEKLEKAVEMCGKSKHNLSSITLITTSADNVYCGINWKTLNDSFEEELTSSEDEALHKMLLTGETAIDSIVTLDPETKLPVNPCQKCLELMIKINPANMSCNVLSGKNSKVVLTSLNSEIAKFAESFADQTALAASAVQMPQNEAPADSAQNDSADSSEEPEGSAAHTGIDASGLQMIFDDWESSSESAVPAESKPFNANSLNSTQQEIINTVQNMSQNGGNNPYQQQNGNMYGQQPMNNMYGQQPMMNNMYGQQQPMNNNNMYGQQQSMNNNMYRQQPMNNMYGQQPMNNMYGQQPMNNMYGQQPMNNMYGQQPMNNMYGQQPMNNMYGGGQQSVMNNMYQQDGRASLYLNNQAPQQTSVYGNRPPSANSSTYLNKLQAPVSHSVANTQSVSVYGTNLNDSDNNAIFKDRLNDILNSTSPKSSKNDDSDMKDVMMSAKEKKNAAKKDAKFLKK